MGFRSDEIYVQPFPGPGAKSQVSANGGGQARWRRDGRELFFVGLDGRLMAVSIRLASDGQSVEAGTPGALFATRIGGPSRASTSGSTWSRPTVNGS